MSSEGFQGLTKVVWLSEDWPPAAAHEGEPARGAARRTTCWLSLGGGVGNTLTTIAKPVLFWKKNSTHRAFVVEYNKQDSLVFIF